MTSPLATYQDYLDRGELACQVTADGRAIFFPRVVAPGDGAALAWKVSAGRGTVHASTTVYRRGEPPLNVCLVELDEGFRLMSRVEDMPPEQVHIGLRVQLRVRAGSSDEPAIPVFIAGAA